MKSVPEVRKAFKERKLEIQRKQKEALREKMRKAEEAEAARLAKLQGYTDKIIFYGLWQTVEQVDSALEELHLKGEKLDALKSQLNFRKHVLKQCPPKEGYENIFTFSMKEAGRVRQLSVEELKVKIKLLVEHAFTVQPTLPDPGEHIPILVSKTVHHKFSCETGETWWREKSYPRYM